MAGILYANDFGGIGAAMQSDEALRQRAWEASMASLMRQREQGQAQRNWEAQMRESADRNAQNLALHNAQLAASEADRAGRLDYQNRGLKLSEDYQNWLMKQKSAATQPMSKEQLDVLGLASSVVERQADETGDVDTKSPVFLSFSPERQAAILAKATATQQRLRPELYNSLGALAAFNEKEDLDKKLEQIKKDRPGFLSRLTSLDAGHATITALDAAEAAATKRRQELADKLKGVPVPGSEKSLFRRNIETGKVDLDATVPDWLKRELSLPINPIDYGRLPMPSSRQVNMNTATVAAPQGATAIPDSPLARQAQMPQRQMNFAAPPTTTGTNMPPFVRQNGIVFRLMPDGSYQPVTP